MRRGDASWWSAGGVGGRWSWRKGVQRHPRPAFIAQFLVVAVMAVLLGPLATHRATAAAVSVPVSEDARVQADLPGTNFGSDAALGTDNSPVTRTYLRFNVSSLVGESITSAKLRVFDTNASSKGGDLRLVTSPWSEATVTYNTPVSYSSTVVGSLGSVSPGNWYEFDVTSVVGTGNSLDVVITSTSSDGADYASREASSGNGPNLVVTTGGTTPPPPPPGGTLTDVIKAVEDATVDESAPSTNFGQASTLGADNSPVKRFLMKFDISQLAGKSITSAKLRLYDTNSSPKGGDFRLVTSPWSESTVTANTPVSIAPTVIGSLGSVSSGRWYELNVANLLAGQPALDLIVSSTNSDGAAYDSSEATSGNGPQLVVTRPANGAPAVTISAPANNATVTVGKPVPFNGSATDEDGNLTAGLVWTSSLDGQIGTGAAPTWTFQTLGERTITAAVSDSQSVQGSASIKVDVVPNAAPKVVISSPADGAGVKVDRAVTFTGSATDEDGNLTAGLVWRSSLDGQIGTGASPAFTFTTLGERTITASVKDADGLEGTAAVRIVVRENQPPVVVISSPANGSPVTQNRPVTFTATATDEDGSATGAITWASSSGADTAPFPTGGNITYAFTTLGGRTLTASATDAEGLTGTAAVNVVVVANQAPHVTISAPANNATVNRGSPVGFSGSATDEDGNLTSNLVWTSPGDGQIGTGGSPTFTFSTTGQRTITATVTDSQNATGSASITITVVAPVVVTFDVGLLGDTGYTSSQVSAFKSFRDSTLNKAGMAFFTHDGDIKSGADSCPDSLYTNWRDIFNGFTSPLIYTPGDNEWKDCPDKDPIERLGFIRKTFFSTNQSLGQTKLTLTQQAGYPENTRWTYGDVVFATINTPGGNNFSSSSEFKARNAANLDWMRQLFAAGQNARGVVLVTQANWGGPYKDGGSVPSGFADSVALLEELTVAYGKPVVFVHGDTHNYHIDHPMTHNGQTVQNFTRVETYSPSSGGSHWVKLSIVADSRVFVPAGQ
jgi:PKD domain-containing protein